MLALIAKAFVTCEAESRDRKMLPSKFLNFFEEFITKALYPASPGAHQYRGLLFSSLSAPDSPHCTPFKDIKNLLFHSLTGRSSSPSSHIA